MEYVQGEPLVDWCDARELDSGARIRLFIQVLDAVGYAHQRQILHRDLKPSNILVTDQGEVRLLDFRVARLLHGDADGSSLTQAWGNALTPAYASPELLRGEPFDLRSDISLAGRGAARAAQRRPAGAPAVRGRRTHRRAAHCRARCGTRLRKHLTPGPDWPLRRCRQLRRGAGGLSPAQLRRALRIGIFWTRHWMVAGLSALALAVAGAVALLRPHTAPAAMQTVAVLPFTEPHGRSRTTGNPRRWPGRGGGEPACRNPGPAHHRPCVELLVRGEERRPPGHCEETRRRQPAGGQPASPTARGCASRYNSSTAGTARAAGHRVPMTTSKAGFLPRRMRSRRTSRGRSPSLWTWAS